MSPNPTLTRRDFLRATGAAAAALGLLSLRLPGQADGQIAGSDGLGAALPGVPEYRTWEDLYREQWRWDRVVRGTHSNTNCTSGCSWDLFVKDDVVWREEQRAPYAATMPGLPDFNPRGCQKGACGSSLMYSPSRVRYPMRRVGERGEGRWQRISWEEALAAIATATVDTVEHDGPASVVCELGTNVGAGPNSAAPLRFFRLLGSPTIDPGAQIGDLMNGATITFGNGTPCGSSDDWFRSEYLVLWTFNPAATRISDAHFLTEARYRGAQVVVVAPDLNATATHADLWLNPRPGTDAALALGAAQVILEEGLYDAAYVGEQTDLPLLVRSDSGRFVREADLVAGGSETQFFVWDTKQGAAVPAPGGQPGARLDDRDVAIGLTFVGTIPLEGKPVAVRTVFSLLREKLDAQHRPEQVAEITGVGAGTIRGFARDFAKVRAAMILAELGQCKFLHGDLAQRAQILLATLTGNIGRAGGGWRGSGNFALEGFVLLTSLEQLGLFEVAKFGAKSYLQPAETMHTVTSYFVPGTIWHTVHGELDVASTDPRYGDSGAPRATADYLREALDKKWFPVSPPSDRSPRVMVSVFGNILRQSRNNVRLLERLWPKLRLVVDVTYRMSETARWADIVLPAAVWYEKVDIKYLASYLPYVHLGDRAVAPLDEAKPEWEIFALLAEAVAAEARRRNLQPYTDIAGAQRDARRLDEAFTDSGRFGAKDEEKALQYILGYSSAVKGVALDDLRRDGVTRFRSTGADGATGYFSDFAADQPMVPHRWFVEKKQRWPTLTGRQQFYVDHPWFLECGEALPTYKRPPAAGGDYPLTLSGGHTRWSIHSQWRDQPNMLRLQRGEPVVYLSAQDAAERQIQDHDLVRLRNDLGSFVLRAKIAAYVQPGQVLTYHAWEPYQFRDGRSDHAVIPSPIKPTSLVGGYGHLQWQFGHWEPNEVDRDTRVEVERISAPAAAPQEIPASEH
ncbi:MAG: molybdopterin-dependent oxidoreductase [Deltaproteobacteria bacterium]|nr:molybdopterin-dependent oxidoreductase [Deltaproteobacteria bacterium]